MKNLTSSALSVPAKNNSVLNYHYHYHNRYRYRYHNGYRYRCRCRCRYCYCCCYFYNILGPSIWPPENSQTST